MWEFVAKLDNQISAGAKEAVSDLQALKGALLDVNKALGGVAKGNKDLANLANPDKTGGKGDKGDDAEKKAKAQSKAIDLLKKGAGKAGGAVEVPLKFVAAAAGIAGFAGPAKLAMGYAGMAKLQALAAQTQLQFRALFRGVDPSPVLRAFEKFSRNLSGSTVTGKALGDVLTRGFNDFFKLVEKLEPLATAAFQGLIIGALYAESAILKAEIALAPYIVAIEKAIGTEDGMRAGALAAAVAFGALAISVAPVTGAITALTAAVGFLIDQWTKLKSEWDDSSWGQIKNKLGQDLGLISQEDAEKAILNKARGNYEKSQANPEAGPPPPPVKPAAPPDAAKAAGATAGQALGQGLVQGMGASEAAVKAAGGKLADAATAGVREKAEIHSPSRVMRQDGWYMGEGVELGIDDKGPDVQAAAESSLVPKLDMPKATPSSASSSAAPIVMHNVFHIVSSNPEETTRAVEEALQTILWKANSALGVPEQVATP